MRVDLGGDVIVVTGGAGGLGSAYCRLLARLGARVVVNDTGGVIDGTGGNPDAAARVAAEIVAAGGQAVGCPEDGSTVGGARAVIAVAAETFGRVDGVIANAGILRDRTFAKTSDEDFFAVVTAHLAGTVRIFRAAVPLMQEQGYGRLVATSSGAGLFGNFGQSAYGAAKLGIVGLTRTIALEFARRGIQANVVVPMAATRMTAGVLEEEVAAGFSPDLVASLVAYLASRECAVTGRIYSVGAGRVARANVGVTRGRSTSKMTPEWVARNIAAIDDDSEYHFFETAADELRLLS